MVCKQIRILPSNSFVFSILWLFTLVLKLEKSWHMFLLAKPVSLSKQTCLKKCIIHTKFKFLRLFRIQKCSWISFTLLGNSVACQKSWCNVGRPILRDFNYREFNRLYINCNISFSLLDFALLGFALLSFSLLCFCFIKFCFIRSCLTGAFSSLYLKSLFLAKDFTN